MPPAIAGRAEWPCLLRTLRHHHTRPEFLPAHPFSRPTGEVAAIRYDTSLIRLEKVHGVVQSWKQRIFPLDKGRRSPLLSELHSWWGPDSILNAGLDESVSRLEI